MSFATAIRSEWDERLSRASDLAERYAFAAELLNFYLQIASFQRELYGFLQSCGFELRGQYSQLPSELDLPLLVPKLQAFLRLAQNGTSPEVAEAARKFGARPEEKQTTLLTDYWRADPLLEFTPGDRFLVHAFLQPLAEYLAAIADFDSGPNYAKSVCPFCGRKPVAGVLRPEGDGGKRSLVCSFCATEWQFRRVVCPNCGETDMGKLPVYIAEEFQHVRVESCDTCKSFLKTIDLTNNGHAIPLIDELATIPLTFWAQEKGYIKLEVNLLGL
jgi:FdhE protein